MFKRQPQVRGAIDRQAEQEKKDGLKSLAFMMLGVVMTIVVGAVFYFLPFGEQEPPKSEQTTSQEVRLKPVEVQNSATTYDFYEILPKQESHGIPRGMSEQAPNTTTKPPKVDVVVVQEQTEMQGAEQVSSALPDQPPQTEPKSVSIHIQKANPDVTYVLQVRSFENAEPAELKRAEVMMAGVDATVVKKENGNGGILYTVVSVPMASRDEAMAAYSRLQTSGIDSVVVEQKRK